MAFARHLLKGDRKEQALLRKADNEHCFGVQIATNQIDEGTRAARMAADAGATFLDLNCGCPIHEATRRGLGAALLRRPAKLARLVNGIAAQSPLPVTVKIRLGESSDKIVVHELVALLKQAGAAVVTVHGRTQEQRYKKPADWGVIEEAAARPGMPLVGNGDVLTLYEARRRLQDHGVLGVMVGR
jgi:tRNA-dihydrouridine synthase 3